MILIPGTRSDMLNAQYWIDKVEDKHKIIMDEDGIQIFNRKVVNNTQGVVNIFDCEKNLEEFELSDLIRSYKIPSEIRYDISGNEISKEFYDSIILNTNIKGINYQNDVRYGITIRNADVRSFPTDEFIFKTKEDKDFDRFQETGCQAFEPVLILHESRDKKWYFVQIYNYTGWMRKMDVAVGERDSVKEFVDSKPFLVVTGNYIQTQYNPLDKRISRLKLYMGTRIPLVDEEIEFIDNQSVLNNYVVKIPVRDENGYLEFKQAVVARTEDVNEGFLPYTRENILKQIFKLLGDRYGWGDRFSGRDCSSTIMYVYKTFGFKLSRNASEQEKGPGKRFEFGECSLEERVELFENAKSGAALYMPGHVMMYLGKDSGIPYVIHNFHGYARIENGELRFIPVNQVFVMSAQAMTYSGKSFLEKFTTIIQFEG